MKQLFLDIETHINGMDGTPFKFVQVYNGQFEDFQEGKNYDFPKPAVLVEFINDQPIQTLGNRTQIYDPLMVRLHIVHEMFNADGGKMERNLEVMDLGDKLFNRFHLFEPNGAVAFTRTNESRDYNHTNIYHFIQDYITNYIQQMDNDDITKAPPIALTIDVTPPSS